MKNKEFNIDEAKCTIDGEDVSSDCVEPISIIPPKQKTLMTIEFALDKQPKAGSVADKAFRQAFNLGLTLTSESIQITYCKKAIDIFESDNIEVINCCVSNSISGYTIKMMVKAELKVEVKE